MIELHIPEEINYECTSCGKCCGGWAVPLTPSDYERISEVNWHELNPTLNDKGLFAKLKNYQKAETPYTHKIVSQTGTCPFLSDNLCFIHSKFNSEFKPSICQLFPYCFTKTPSGVYATVSFVSMGVIYNSGKALTLQKEWLEKKWQDFNSLFPNYQPDWSKLKLTVGQEISWQEYLNIEEKIFEIINNSHISLNERLLQASHYLITQVKNQRTTSAQSSPALNSAEQNSVLNDLDKQLLIAFHKIYFPSRPHKMGHGDFSILRFFWQNLNKPSSLSFITKSIPLPTLIAMPWPDDKEMDNLLYRYVLTYIFGKKYFGAGFGQISLIAGFHHLILVYCLAKLHAKGLAILREAPQVSLIDLVYAIRELETHLGETKISSSAAAAFELLLYSPKRIKRLLRYPKN